MKTGSSGRLRCWGVKGRNGRGRARREGGSLRRLALPPIDIEFPRGWMAVAGNVWSRKKGRCVMVIAGDIGVTRV